MADRLQNILAFGSVGAGATVVLPHLLQIHDVALVPDKIWAVTTGDVTITADDVNVSVTNNGASATDVDTLVYADHSVLRAFGAKQTTALTPQPFVMFCGATVPPTTDTTQVFRFTATALAQSAIVLLPAARANNNYIVEVTPAGLSQFLMVDCPVVNRTTTQFTLTTSTSMAVGDAFDIVVRDPT